MDMYGYLHALPGGTCSRLGPWYCQRLEASSSWQGNPFDNVSVERQDENG
jgi:hypothetical protein